MSTGPRINFNAPAMVNVNRLNQLEKGLMRSMQRVSSGERITRPADDVAAHGISEKTRGQIRCLSVASRNVQDGIALINVAEAALNEVHDMLHRMRELGVQAANGTQVDLDREFIEVEINKLKEEINFITENTHYNGHKLLNGTGDWGGSVRGGHFQIGTTSQANIDYISHRIPKVDTETLGLADMSMATQEEALEAIDKVRLAVEQVNGVRASLGGIANRLEHSWRNVDRMVEDNQAFESKLRDVDVAEEMIYITRDQIIHQYCSAMLAQANQTPQSILQLLR